MVGCTSFSLKLPNLRSSAATSSGVSADSGVDVPLSAHDMSIQSWYRCTEENF